MINSEYQHVSSIVKFHVFGMGQGSGLHPINACTRTMLQSSHFALVGVNFACTKLLILQACVEIKLNFTSSKVIYIFCQVMFDKQTRGIENFTFGRAKFLRIYTLILIFSQICTNINIMKSLATQSFIEKFSDLWMSGKCSHKIYARSFSKQQLKSQGTQVHV